MSYAPILAAEERRRRTAEYWAHEIFLVDTLCARCGAWRDISLHPDGSIAWESHRCPNAPSGPKDPPRRYAPGNHWPNPERPHGARLELALRVLAMEIARATLEILSDDKRADFGALVADWIQQHRYSFAARVGAVTDLADVEMSPGTQLLFESFGVDDEQLAAILDEVGS